MPSLSAQKVNGFLSSPHTYPRSGLGFGTNAGAVSATKGGGPMTVNRMNAQGTTFKMNNATDPQAQKKINAGFHIQKTAEEIKGMTMLEKIKQLGLEKYAGDEDMADDFVKGFVTAALSKEAGEFSPAMELAKGFSGAMGKGLAGVAMSLGAVGIGAAVKSMQGGHLHTEFLGALHRAIETNPILRQAKKEKVVNYADTIFKFAPHVATDANLLSSILANAIHGEGIDPMTVRTLTDLESRYTETTSVGSFSPKAYV
jgi:hypothetical protein